MVPIDTLLAFVAASLVLLVLPGPGVLYVVGCSLGRGRRAGVVAAAGLSVGALAHVVAAVVGLSAILVASATAFGIVKWLGAAYLFYLGIQAIRARGDAGAVKALSPLNLKRTFLDGVIVSIFNPKIALFFLAFFPQFISPTAGSATAQIVLLGLLYAVLAFLSDGLYALLASTIRPLFSRAGRSGLISRYVTGGLFIGLAVKAAVTERPE